MRPVIVAAMVAGIVAACSSAPTAPTGSGTPAFVGTGACAYPAKAPAVATGMPSGPIGHAGRWLTDAEGRVLLLHGVNVVAKDSPYYPCAFGFDGADAAWLAAGSLDVVRLGVLPSGEMPDPGRIDQGYIDHLVDTIDDLAAHHVFTLLDWHQDDYGTAFDRPGTKYRADGLPAWMTDMEGAPNHLVGFPSDYAEDAALQHAFQAFWDDKPLPGGKDLQSYYLTMLTAVAKRVSGDPWVLGYEIMNEPWPGVVWAPCFKGCPAIEHAELDPFYAKAVSAIRSVDGRHMIFLEPFSTFNFGLSPTSLAVPAGATNVGLAFHQYAQVPGLENLVFVQATNWARATGGALLNTEWSATGGNPATVASQAGEADAALVPWTYWIFDNCDIACSPATVANLLLDPLRPPVGANVNALVADRVVRPYPIAVAGTPLSVVYDNTTRVLHATWSTQRAGAGGAFGAGALSAIAAPLLDYPGGYRVQVSGATVASAQCAPVLVVRQSGSAATVSVVITPGGGCA